MAAATKRRRKAAGPKVDSYQVVTDLIVGALEQGVVPWHRPWKSNGEARLPRSLSSRKAYRGVNVWTLLVTAQMRGYTSPWWGTYNQIAERGGQVRKGEKGTPVVFWKPIELPDPDDETKKKQVLLLKHFVVFNACQAEGDLKLPTGTGAPKDLPPVAACDAVVAGYQSRGGPPVRNGGNIAGWHPTLDEVVMPLTGYFDSIDAYYGALFHELGHSTGHEARLNRPEAAAAVAFGTPDYSREELVAEMTAAFCCGAAGIDVNVPYRASYIASWLTVLRDDKKMVVSAGAAAQKAADLILGLNATDPEEDPA